MEESLLDLPNELIISSLKHTDFEDVVRLLVSSHKANEKISPLIKVYYNNSYNTYIRRIHGFPNGVTNTQKLFEISENDLRKPAFIEYYVIDISEVNYSQLLLENILENNDTMKHIVIQGIGSRNSLAISEDSHEEQDFIHEDHQQELNDLDGVYYNQLLFESFKGIFYPTNKLRKDIISVSFKDITRIQFKDVEMNPMNFRFINVENLTLRNVLTLDSNIKIRFLGKSEIIKFKKGTIHDSFDFTTCEAKSIMFDNIDFIQNHRFMNDHYKVVLHNIRSLGSCEFKNIEKLHLKSIFDINEDMIINNINTLLLSRCKVPGLHNKYLPFIYNLEMDTKYDMFIPTGKFQDMRELPIQMPHLKNIGIDRDYDNLDFDPTEFWKSMNQLKNLEYIFISVKKFLSSRQKCDLKRMKELHILAPGSIDLTKFYAPYLDSLTLERVHEDYLINPEKIETLEPDIRKHYIEILEFSHRYRDIPEDFSYYKFNLLAPLSTIDRLRAPNLTSLKLCGLNFGEMLILKDLPKLNNLVIERCGVKIMNLEGVKKTLKKLKILYTFFVKIEVDELPLVDEYTCNYTNAEEFINKERNSKSGIYSLHIDSLINPETGKRRKRMHS